MGIPKIQGPDQGQLPKPIASLSKRGTNSTTRKTHCLNNDPTFSVSSRIYQGLEQGQSFLPQSFGYLSCPLEYQLVLQLQLSRSKLSYASFQRHTLYQSLVS